MDILDFDMEVVQMFGGVVPILHLPSNNFRGLTSGTRGR